MFEKEIFKSPALQKALLAMKLLAGGLGTEAVMGDNAYATEPTVEVSHSKTKEDVKQEKIQKMADRKKMIDRLFKAVKIDLALTDDPYFEEYSVKVNGVKIGEVQQDVKLFAKRVDFYSFDSDTEFIQKLQGLLDNAEVSYTLNAAETGKLEAAEQINLLEQAKAEITINIDGASEKLFKQWGGEVTGWIIGKDGKPKFQFAPSAQDRNDPLLIETDTKSLSMKAIDDDTVLITCINKDGSVQILHVVDGKVLEL